MTSLGADVPLERDDFSSNRHPALQKGHPLSKPTSSEYIRGSLYGLAAVSMWAAWVVAVRYGIKTSLKPWDLTAIRFGVAGLILLPYLLKKGLAVDRLGGLGLAAIVLGGGAPMVLLSYSIPPSYPCMLPSWPRSCLARPSPLPSGSDSS
jgi:hypothetical protein